MKTKKKQILVLTDFSKISRYAVEHSALLAKIFDADLNILFVKNKTSAKISENISNIRAELHDYATDINNQFFVKTFYFALEGKLDETILQIAKKVDALFLIIGYNKNHISTQYNIETVGQIIKSSQQPVIVIKNKLSEKNFYKNVIIPLNFNCENKEKVSWANFFGKFNNAKIIIVQGKAKKPEQKQKSEIKRNEAIESLERNKVDYAIHSTKAKNKHIDFASLQQSKTLEADLCFFLLNQKQAILNSLFRANEIKLLKSEISTSLMFVK
ncbi:MAG: universal stress protein [Bacteroidetes bacterium]|nr:universal stress protein [Bacteroidota bacterium]MBT6686767.1 universal stress protein [Bacteroidota bacterium]MBT7141994.1 universal stress protein [Bacteroidota bacterium]MBT7492496.1 universal stress protein [Bacteroidota bacterium]